jgi:hypothetical protein
MKKVFALLVVMAMLALPTAAFAGTGPGYGMPQGTVQTTIENGSSPKKATQSVPAAATSTPAPEQKGSLPFTGLQVGLVAIAGLALVGTGVGLRKLGGSHSGS